MAPENAKIELVSEAKPIRSAAAADVALSRARERTEKLRGFREQLASGSLTFGRGIELAAEVTSLRIEGHAPLRLARVELSYLSLELGDRFRAMSAPETGSIWITRLSEARSLIWLQLAAGEVRAARQVASTALLWAGTDFGRLRAEITEEEFHESHTLETLAELIYLGGPPSLFYSLGEQTVYDEAPDSERAGDRRRYTFRGSLLSRPAYQRLPVAGPGAMEKLRNHVLDELIAHSREQQVAPDPARSIAFRTCGLIVLGSRLGLQLRADSVPEDQRPSVQLVWRLMR